MSDKLIIFGNSAFAEIAYEYFSQDTNYKVVCFTVESNFIIDKTLFNLPVVPYDNLLRLYPPDNHSVFVAITYTKLNRLRTKFVNNFKLLGYKLASYISPKAFIPASASIGEHCFIFENNVIQPKVNIFSNVIIWSGNHIGHHSIIYENCFISSHVVISGYCSINSFTFIGVNSTISNNISISRDNWIGPNVFISRDTLPEQLITNNSEVTISKFSTIRYFKVS